MQPFPDITQFARISPRAGGGWLFPLGHRPRLNMTGRDIKTETQRAALKAALEALEGES